MQRRELEDLAAEADRLAYVGRVRLRSLEEVERWAASHGGELAVRNALANQSISRAESVRLAELWLAQRERQRTDAHARETLEVDRRAAQAAERAARWAMWSALVSLVTVGVSVIASCASRM